VTPNVIHVVSSAHLLPPVVAQRLQRTPAVLLTLLLPSPMPLSPKPRGTTSVGHIDT